MLWRVAAKGRQLVPEQELVQARSTITIRTRLRSRMLTARRTSVGTRQTEISNITEALQSDSTWLAVNSALHEQQRSRADLVTAKL